jgi:hypothetical protein
VRAVEETASYRIRSKRASLLMSVANISQQHLQAATFCMSRLSIGRRYFQQQMMERLFIERDPGLGRLSKTPNIL